MTTELRDPDLVSVHDVCENSSFYLSCPVGSTIKIDSKIIFYGRWSQNHPCGDIEGTNLNRTDYTCYNNPGAGLPARYGLYSLGVSVLFPLYVLYFNLKWSPSLYSLFIETLACLYEDTKLLLFSRCDGLEFCTVYANESFLDTTDPCPNLNVSMGLHFRYSCGYNYPFRRNACKRSVTNVSVARGFHMNGLWGQIGGGCDDLAPGEVLVENITDWDNNYGIKPSLESGRKV